MADDDQADEKPSFEAALGAWLAAAQRMIDEYFAKTYQHTKPPKLEAQAGGVRYVRIVSKDPGAKTGSAYAFVEIATGDVLKPDGWKRPAKGARGNIYDPERPGVGVHGALYAAEVKR